MPLERECFEGGSCTAKLERQRAGGWQHKCARKREHRKLRARGCRTRRSMGSASMQSSRGPGARRQAETAPQSKRSLCRREAQPWQRLATAICRRSELLQRVGEGHVEASAMQVVSGRGRRGQTRANLEGQRAATGSRTEQARLLQASQLTTAEAAPAAGGRTSMYRSRRTRRSAEPHRDSTSAGENARPIRDQDPPRRDNDHGSTSFAQAGRRPPLVATGTERPQRAAHRVVQNHRA